jgi:hypothetical protein
MSEQPKSFPALERAVENWVPTDIATYEQARAELKAAEELLAAANNYRTAVDAITSTYSSHALEEDCTCDWCMEQREGLLLGDAIAACERKS